MDTVESKASLAIRASLVKAVIRELKASLDTQVVRASLDTAVTQELVDSPAIRVKADIQVSLGSQDIRVTLEFPVTVDRWERVVIRESLE